MDTLFGDIIETLKTPEFGGDIYSVGKSKEEQKAFARKIGIRMRDEILNSKRYHLSADFSKNATLLAYNVDDPIKDLIDKARVPFESIWIEWPVKAKLEAIGLEFDDHSSEFAGVLIKRINNSPNNFIITAVERGKTSKIKGRFIDWSPVSIEVNLSKPMDQSYQKEKMKYFKYPILKLANGNLPNGHDEDEFVRAYMQATLIGGKTELDIELHQNLKSLVAITDYATQCLTPYYGEIYYSSIATEGLSPKFRENLFMVLGTILKQHAGLFRFILSVLALLNEKDYIDVKPIKPGKSRPGSTSKPKLQPFYNFVTMNAPHNVFLKEKLEQNEVRREVMRHEVTGTWVNYHKTGKEDCKHTFANMDETGNKKICMLCGRRKSWRRDHERGNIELGFKPRQARLVFNE